MSELLREFKCLECDHAWKVPFGSGRQMTCPQCGGNKIKRTNPGMGNPWRGKGRKGNGNCKHS